MCRFTVGAKVKRCRGGSAEVQQGAEFNRGADVQEQSRNRGAECKRCRANAVVFRVQKWCMQGCRRAKEQRYKGAGAEGVQTRCSRYR